MAFLIFLDRFSLLELFKTVLKTGLTLEQISLKSFVGISAHFVTSCQYELIDLFSEKLNINYSFSILFEAASGHRNVDLTLNV